MMGGIGDYVHYRLENYRKYGTGTESSPMKADPIKVFQEQKKSIQRSATRQQKAIDTAALSAELNQYYNLNSQLSRGILNQDTLILKEMQKQLESQLQKRWGNVHIDWSNLEVSMSDFSFDGAVVQANQELDNTMTRYRNSKLNTAQEHKVNAKSVVNRIMALHELRKTLLQNGSVEDAKALGAKIAKIRKEYMSIRQSLQGARRISVAEHGDFISELNKTFSDWKRKSCIQASGDLAEMLILVLKDCLKCVGTSAVGQVVTNSLADTFKNQGRNTSTKGLAVQFFSPDIRMQSYKDGKGGISKTKSAIIKDPSTGLEVMVETGAHGSKQGKVDVTLSFAGGTNASIKNYNLAHPKVLQNGISIHDGSSYLLFAQEYPNFVNHYLNIMASHPDGNSGIGEIQAAKEAMKMTILLKSLRGGFITSNGIMDSADVLIVNDKSTKRMKVIAMNEIVDKIADNMDLMRLTPEPQSNLTNEFVKINGNSSYSMHGARVRIEKLITQLDKAKVSASIMPAVLN